MRWKKAEKNNSDELLKAMVKREIENNELIGDLRHQVTRLSRELSKKDKDMYEYFNILGNEICKLKDDINRMKKDIAHTTARSTATYKTESNNVMRQTVVQSGSALSVKEQKSDCELFNEQVNSGTLPPQFKSIKLTYEGNNRMVENPEGINLFYIVEKENDNYELYPNHKIKELRVVNAVKDVYEVDYKGSSKIVVDRPCILRKLMYGYGIESKGKVRIL